MTSESDSDTKQSSRSMAGKKAAQTRGYESLSAAGKKGAASRTHASRVEGGRKSAQKRGYESLAAAGRKGGQQSRGARNFRKADRQNS